MIFQESISAALGNSPETPTVKIMPVRWGIVHKLELDFPNGAAGLVGVMIKRGGIQLWPTTEGEWFKGNDRLISFQVFKPFLQPPFQVEIYYYNEDSMYNHSMPIRLGILPPWAVYFTSKESWDAWGDDLLG